VCDYLSEDKDYATFLVNFKEYKMRDANTEALYKYLNEIEQAEQAIENFINEIQPLIDEIKQIQKTYEGYELDETLQELING